MDSYILAIKKSKFSIYDSIQRGDKLWIPDKILQAMLQKILLGKSLKGMPPRSRSKFVKEAICLALGYPVPISFQKTQPRFPGQNFDTYIQKSHNLQIWNEEIAPERRYVIIQVLNDKIAKVRVLNGLELSQYDKTGTLTIKHQATFIPNGNLAEILSSDTKNIKSILKKGAIVTTSISPVDLPAQKSLLSIEEIFLKLSPIIGLKLKHSGFDQDRNRGAELHKIVCKYLGYTDYHDNGQFPDVLNQLLEVKLQTSPTIDLGRICPDSKLSFRDFSINKRKIKHCDIRYALFYGVKKGNKIVITHFSLTSGERFFDRFAQFLGKTVNKKIQLPLPKNFFDL